MYIIPDIFKDITIAIQAEYGNPVYFMHGHRVEIVNILSEKDKSDVHKFKKYPVIILHHDIKKVHNSPNYAAECDVNIVIATESDVKFDSDDRYDNSFKTELYPLLDLFIEQIESSSKIVSTMDGSDFAMTTTDRLYWGKQSIAGNTANSLNDAIDAIEIDLKFNLLYDVTPCF